MITIEIGLDRRTLDAASESWITEQINKRKADKQSVCVRITINSGSVNMVLSTPNGQGAGGGRLPNQREREILDLWAKHKLNSMDFHGGNVIAFLKQLSHMSL